MQVSELLHKLRARQESFKEAKGLYVDRLAPDFSPFDFIQPDELRLSGMLAWLLNPQATHGQSGRFLHLFVKQLFQHDPELSWPSEACEKAKVRTEVWVSDGKLDILVESNDRTLVIENKAGAADQPKQIERYAAYLGNLEQVATRLVYLTPDGVEPSKESITEPERVERTKTGQLHCWSYQEHILKWLAECRAVCRADRVSVFIDEFAQYIRKRFAGIADMTEQNQLVQDVTESLATLAPAMQVILAADAIRVRLLSKLHDQIQTEIGQIEGWSLADWNLSTKRWSFFQHQVPW